VELWARPLKGPYRGIFSKKGWHRVIAGPEKRSDGGSALFVQLEGEDPYRWFSVDLFELKEKDED